MFVSYAQNFEDVILNRLFGDRKSGFYIDVGAQHPYYDSVTKAFYDRGWQGINIEPVKKYYDLLAAERSRDINLNFALGETESELTFYELEGTGLSTFERETAEEIANKDGYNISTYQVPVKKLGDICQQYVQQSIDFLKIDVEGWEENVILGHHWDNFRPIVVLLEATIPNSPVRKETNIRQILTAKNYEHVYFDGLNDYYLAAEHNYLKQHFQVQPNVFDKFISPRIIEAQDKTKQKEEELHTVDRKYNELFAESKQKEEELQNLHQQYNELFAESKQKEEELQNLHQQYNELFSENQKVERQLHILNNKYKDIFAENSRLTQKFNAQKKIHLAESDRYAQQIKQLQTELSQAQQRVAAMETSKFWRLRLAWFKAKKLVGIKGD